LQTFIGGLYAIFPKSPRRWPNS